MPSDDQRPDRSDRAASEQTASRRAFLRATAAGAALGVAGGVATTSATAEVIPTPYLTREGNTFQDPSGNDVILRGVNIVDPYRAAHAAPYYKRRPEKLVEMATGGTNGWHSKVIRVPLQPQDIVASASPDTSVNAGMEPPGGFSQSELEDYLSSYVDPTVQKCKEVGVYCIIDYHRHYPEGPAYTDPAIDDEVQMFWQTVAPRYAEESHVIYEVYNEPVEPYAGDDIYNGGPDVTDPESEETWLTWREAAQPWVDTIQELAPQNPVLIGSPRWSQWTYWAPEHEFDGDNLGYVGHVYTQEGMRPLSTYFGEPAEEVPVFMTEFGWGGAATYLQGDRETYGPEFASLFDEYPISWTAWSFDFNWDPGMLNRQYEVANGWGEWTRDRLAEYKDSDLPSGSGSSTPTDTPTDTPTETPTDMPESDGPTFPEGATDPDGDGEYEDLNGNGEVDFDDVTTYFRNVDTVEMSENVQYYDYNGNGKVDFADLIQLFRQV